MKLIDADKLIEELTIKAVSKDAHIISIANAVVNLVNNQPIAYSVEKVVEKLEEIRVKKTCNKEKCDTKEICRICVVDDAIEIVKNGGVGKDVD